MIFVFGEDFILSINDSKDFSLGIILPIINTTVRSGRIGLEEIIRTRM